MSATSARSTAYLPLGNLPYNTVYMSYRPWENGVHCYTEGRKIRAERTYNYLSSKQKYKYSTAFRTTTHMNVDRGRVNIFTGSQSVTQVIVFSVVKHHLNQG